jgi:hypothetical protein
MSSGVPLVSHSISPALSLRTLAFVKKNFCPRMMQTQSNDKFHGMADGEPEGMTTVLQENDDGKKECLHIFSIFYSVGSLPAKSPFSQPAGFNC